MLQEIEVDIRNDVLLFIETNSFGEISIKEKDGEIRISVDGRLAVVPKGDNAINLINIEKD